MKKLLALLLAILVLPVFALSASAETTPDISIRFFSDTAGCTETDAERLALPLSEGIRLDDHRSDPIMLCDYTNAYYGGALAPGRTYYAYFSFIPAEGYEFPEEFTDENVSFECEEGCSVIWYGKARGADGTGGTYDVLSVYIKIKVPGSVFQRIIGMLLDIMLKIRSWSLY